MNKLLTTLKKSKNILYTFNSKDYEKVLYKLYKTLDKKYKKIAVINLNKSHEVISKKLQDKKIKTNKFFFVDCTSKTKGEYKNCIHVSSPSALTELALIIDKLSNKVEIIVLDNLSGLLLYNNEFQVVKFLHSTIEKLSRKKVRTAYLILSSTKKKVVDEVSLFVDTIIED